MNFQVMTVSSIANILEIEHRIFEHTFWTELQFLDCIHSKQYYSVCMYDNNQQLIGYAILLLITKAQEAELMTIGIDIDFQNKSYAQTLFSHLIQQCIQLNIEKIFLEVRISNVKAQKFYIKQGFDIIGKRKKYYKISNNLYEDAILMSKIL